MILRTIKLVMAGLYHLGERAVRPLRRRSPGTLVVLMYHAVKPAQRSVFGRHLDALLRAGTPIGTAGIPGLRAGRRHIAVTFDDGFRSFVENALPALRERQVPATCFVPAGCLGRKPAWIGPGRENADETVMTEDDLTKLPEPLITIGSHGLTHVRLAEIGPEAARHELVDSKRRLEEILRRPVTAFAFPHGSCDAAVIGLAREAGYHEVFLNVPTSPGSSAGGFVVGRIDVLLDDWPLEVVLKMRGAYEWLPLAMRAKAALLRPFRRRQRNHA
jgi:peptidoglycan/xylan/chitin deacetylase (PgdA/CDA1 family)